MRQRERHRAVPLVLLAVILVVSPFAAAAAELAVDVKNDGTESVSVRAGLDNGVTKESDFLVIVSDNLFVAVYPAEIFGNRFWSQPLPTEVFRRIKPGMLVRTTALSKVDHARVRSEGRARVDELKARQEDARRQVARRKVQDLKEQREALLERRDALEDRIAAAEKDLADEEGRLEWAINSADDDIDRATQRIAELADRRDELQSQRSALAQQPSSARTDTSRLTSDVKVISGQINTERERVRFARDRKRTARSAYLSRKQDWQKLVADRNGVVNEIRSLDLQIRELSSR